MEMIRLSGKQNQLDHRVRYIFVLDCRGDFIEPANVIMRIVLFESKELLRSHHIDETMLKLELLSKNQRDYDCFYTSFGGYTEHFSHSTIISHRSYEIFEFEQETYYGRKSLLVLLVSEDHPCQTLVLNQATVQDGRVVVQNVQGRQNRGQGNNARRTGAAGYRGAQNRVRNANLGQARQIKCYNCNGICHIARNCNQPKRPQNSEYLKTRCYRCKLRRIGWHWMKSSFFLSQADECDVFDFDVDEASTTQTMFMANLSFADPVYDEAGSSYDSDILSEVHDHDNYHDVVCELHDVHDIHDNVQPNCVVDSYVAYMSDSNMISYDQMLPTKSQVKINIFALIFLEFEKTCKKRITPTGLTAEEKDFEQTKECYLTEVIPFFKTLKEHFEDVQKGITKEIKEMKEIFEELEAEVDQNAINRKCDEIERKNILIVNDNLIVDCLSKEVFYIATNSELTVSRFTEMHDAHTVVQARCLELEA
nr:DNA-binding protein HEXBP-like [Tanacetum cinerariifolium]